MSLTRAELAEILADMRAIVAAAVRDEVLVIHDQLTELGENINGMREEVAAARADAAAARDLAAGAQTAARGALEEAHAVRLALAEVEDVTADHGAQLEDHARALNNLRRPTSRARWALLGASVFAAGVLVGLALG